MKTVMVLLLLCSLGLEFSANQAPEAIGRGSCCLKFSSAKIPRLAVVSYYRTGPSCPIAGIVFVTKRGRHICVNPTDSWVMGHVAAIDSEP